MICLLFFPHRKVNGFFSPIQDSIIFPKGDERKEGVGVGGI